MDLFDYGVLKQIFNREEFLFIGRLLLSSVLGGLIGWERESSNKQAGLKTHLLVSLGSCLLMLVSIYGFIDWIDHPNARYDPARLAAQVVNGIGFLAAGAILVRPDLVVSGLTTAASLWVSMGIGLAVGSGNYFMAITTTTLVLVVLIILPHLERRVRRKEEREIQFIVNDRPGLLADISLQFKNNDIRLLQSTIVPLDDGRIKLNLKVIASNNLDKVILELRKKEGIVEIEK